MKKLMASFVLSLSLCGFIQLAIVGIDKGIDRLGETLEDFDIPAESMWEIIIGASLVCTLTLTINDRILGKKDK